VDREQKLGKPAATASPADSEHARSDAAHGGAAHNPALSEIYERLYPEIRRQRPNQEAITAALQAMQRLATEMDSEQAAEDGAAESLPSSTSSCPSCGHQNRAGTRFCAKCGLSAEGGRAQSTARSSVPPAEPLPQTPDTGAMQEFHPPAGSAGAVHHYHHHYHHHYLPGGSDTAFVAPRVNAPESAREADRLRLAAAAKGEPMSRSEAAVRRLTQEWVLACNTRQLDELLDLYAPDALVLRSNLPAIRGAAAVREFFFSALEAGLGEVSVEPMRVEVAGDLAHEVGRYSALVPGTAGKRREERGKYLWVFSKQSSGDWKLISECWSADLTLAGAESDVPKSPGTSASKGIPRKGL
jgi:uncharacterized protein (TIGR02246 family)